jgi:nucleoside-diphosphate-sugar epimerase
LKNALTEIDTVYHCAAMVSLGNTGNEMIDINVNGTKMIVDLCLELNVKKLCFVSSIAACGHLKGINPVNEETPFQLENVNSMYAKSKYLSEQEVWKGISNGLNAVIVNPGVILGYSGNNNGSAKLFSLVKNGLIFYTNGGTGYVDVQDVVKIMIALTESKTSGERFILVGENKSNRDILGYIADGLGKPKPFIGMGKSLLISIGAVVELAGKLFGFTPLLDSTGAKSATSRSWYSNQKIINKLQIKFTPINVCITGVCQFMIRKSG